MLTELRWRGEGVEVVLDDEGVVTLGEDGVEEDVRSVRREVARVRNVAPGGVEEVDVEVAQHLGGKASGRGGIPRIDASQHVGGVDGGRVRRLRVHLERRV